MNAVERQVREYSQEGVVPGKDDGVAEGEEHKGADIDGV